MSTPIDRAMAEVERLLRAASAEGVDAEAYRLHTLGVPTPVIVSLVRGHVKRTEAAFQEQLARIRRFIEAEFPGEAGEISVSASEVG